MLTKEQFETLHAKKAFDVLLMCYINQSGYAGCTKDGRIVDRRFYPDAIPVAQNEYLGIPKPRPLPGEEQPATEFIFNDDTDIINLTPNDVVIYDFDRRPELELPAFEGVIPKVIYRREHVATLDGIPITRTVMTDVANLPDPKPNTYYIVSRMVRSAVPDRLDLLVPTDFVRDNVTGKVIGCQSLSLT